MLFTDNIDEDETNDGINFKLEMCGQALKSKEFKQNRCKKSYMEYRFGRLDPKRGLVKLDTKELLPSEILDRVFHENDTLSRC